MVANIQKMTKIKALYNIVDGFVGTIWGLTIIDLVPALFMGVGILDGVERWLQIVMALFGIVWGIFRWKHKRQMDKEALESARIENEIKKQELQSLAKKNGKDFNIDIDLK